ncbi:MAG: ABC transporter permease [Candidatus Reconcilbacillus cellulovorans]|uniref:ABC transporter permease n=1 Tax=Candidatus Reconcilbacillus cellulovorans TaxID=1906605 RepID=A0A2A6E3V4_9BACL|nr:MAG: ABC transporter permease [Candidatus Reconcilbacillus cellulovorans]
MAKVWHLAVKDLRLLMRDVPGLVFLFITPIVIIAVASFALSGVFANEARPFDLPVVLEDDGEAARALVDALSGIGAFRVLTTYEGDEGGQAQMTRNKAKQLLKDTKAAVVIPNGFSDALAKGEPAKLIVLSDPSDRVIPSVVHQTMTQLATQLALARSGQRLPPVEVVQEVPVDASGERPTPFEANVPGYAVMFMLLGTTMGAVALLEERENGTLRKLRTLPVSAADILGGKALSNFLTALVQSAVLFAAGRLLFGMRLGESIAGLILMIVCTAFAATGQAMLLASLCKTRAQANGVSILVVLTMSALGGSWWPLYIEPEWMQKAAHVTVTAWAMDGFTALLVYGGGLADVWRPATALAAMGAAFLAAGWWRFSRKERFL